MNNKKVTIIILAILGFSIISLIPNDIVAGILAGVAGLAFLVWLAVKLVTWSRVDDTEWPTEAASSSTVEEMPRRVTDDLVKFKSVLRPLKLVYNRTTGELTISRRWRKDITCHRNELIRFGLEVDDVYHDASATNMATGFFLLGPIGALMSTTGKRAQHKYCQSIKINLYTTSGQCHIITMLNKKLSVNSFEFRKLYKEMKQVEAILEVFQHDNMKGE